jgi:hypothetical protein
MKMKKFIFVTAIISSLALMTLFTGCIRVDMTEKNGPITSQSYNFTDFTGIETGHAFDLEVVQSTSYSINITAGENILKHINVSKSGSTLKIDLDGWHIGWWWSSGPKVSITMPALTLLDLSGASHGNALGFRSSSNFKVKLSGASSLDMNMETGFFTAEVSGASTLKGILTAAGSDIDLSGASHIELTGSGGDIKLHASGASTAALAFFSVIDADIEFTGASNGSINVSGRLDVDLSGASSLDYLGNPTLGNIDVSGASSLKRKD